MKRETGKWKESRRMHGLGLQTRERERENPENDTMVELCETGRWKVEGFENREVEKRSLITLKFNVSS